MPVDLGPCRRSIVAASVGWGRAVGVGASAMLAPAIALGQCPASQQGWIGGEAYPGVNGPVGAAIVATPPGGGGGGGGGTGERLIVGGDFSFAGVTPAQRLAAWDGAHWTAPFGAGVDGPVHALAMYNGDLIAAGDFATAGGSIAASNIARWNGASWQPLGAGLDGGVSALAVLNGTLYVAGAFMHAGGPGGSATAGIAAWSDATQSWSAVGAIGIDGPVLALAAFGGSLYAGGTFTHADLVPAAGVARWDPTAAAWNALGSGVAPADVRSLVPTGSALFVGGHFTSAGGITSYGAAEWNGASWSGAGSGLYYRTCVRYSCTNHPYSVGVLGAGPAGGPALYASTDPAAGSTPLLFDFSGASWPGAGTLASATTQAPGITTLVAYNGSMYLGGAFSGRNAPNNFARLSGTGTAALWGLVNGMDGAVRAMLPYGSGVVAVGDFTQADGLTLNHAGVFDGAAWHPLGGGITTAVTGGAVPEQVTNVAAIGSDLYVGAWPGGVLHWNGSAWSVLYGAGAFGGPPVVAAWNGQVVCGASTGGFTVPEGNSSNIGLWSGSGWTPLGEYSGLSGSLQPLATLGGALYAASYLGVSRITSATGEWGSVGSASLGGGAYALAVHDGSMYASVFDSQTATVGYVKKLNGSTWQQLDGTFDAYPLGLASVNGDLYALGGFTNIDGVPIAGIARWDTASGSWQPVGGGADGAVLTLAGLNGNVLAGGSFTSIAGLGYANFAIYGCQPVPPCRADFNASGSTTVQDIFDFLSAWFAGAPSADVNGIGGITVQDIFDFLAAWFAGCA